MKELLSPFDHQVPTSFSRPDRLHDPLYVIIPLFNQVRYRSRWKLYEDFLKRCHESGAVPITVECAFGRRDHAFTQATDPLDIQLRTNTELWFKENLINIGISRLPSDWKYVAWVDADVAFSRDDWANETIHQLQHYSFVQMWSQALDLGPNYEIVADARSFVWCYYNEPELPEKPGEYYYGRKRGKKGTYWHPGYAWAARREAIDHVGGLIDWSIIGAADYHMAYCLVGEIDRTISEAYTPAYRRMLYEWQHRCDLHIRRNIGYVDGLLLHHWHGKKINRQFGSRWRVLYEAQYDPDVDLKRDWQGLWQLTDRSIKLRDGLRRYFRTRNEDSIDL